MRTVGQIFKETREEKVYSLEEVEKATKIRKELLVALESDDYSKLPPATFVQGFIKNYAKFLGLDCEKMLAVFRRGFSDKKHAPYVMDAFAHPVQNSRFKLAPGQVLGGMIVLLVLTFFGYLWVQYHQFVGAPALTISSPADQLTADEPTITLKGQTDPDAKITVNGQDVAVDASGNFQEDITLSAPVNKLTITSISHFGQQATQERTVYLKR